MSDMTKEERLKLQIAACKVRMGVIESTHGAKACLLYTSDAADEL